MIVKRYFVTLVLASVLIGIAAWFMATQLGDPKSSSPGGSGSSAGAAIAAILFLAVWGTVAGFVAREKGLPVLGWVIASFIAPLQVVLLLLPHSAKRRSELEERDFSDLSIVSQKEEVLASQEESSSTPPVQDNGKEQSESPHSPASPAALPVEHQPSGGDPGAIGCFTIGVLILTTGLVLLVARPPSWGIPGIIPLIVMALGWAAVSVTRKDAFGSRRAYGCPHCTKSVAVRAKYTGPVKCPHCKLGFTAPSVGEKEIPST